MFCCESGSIYLFICLFICINFNSNTFIVGRQFYRDPPEYWIVTFQCCECHVFSGCRGIGKFYPLLNTPRSFYIFSSRGFRLPTPGFWPQVVFRNENAWNSSFFTCKLKKNSTVPCQPSSQVGRVPPSHTSHSWPTIPFAFTCNGWQVTLCDPLWQVTSRSSEMGFPWRAISSAFTFFTPPTPRTLMAYDASGYSTIHPLLFWSTGTWCVFIFMRVCVLFVIMFFLCYNLLLLLLSKCRLERCLFVSYFIL